MPAFQSAVAFGPATGRRFIVTATDGSVYVTISAAANGAVPRLKANAQFNTPAIDYFTLKLPDAQSGAGTRLLVSDNVAGRVVQAFFVNSGTGKAQSYDIPYVPSSTQPLRPKEYLGYRSTSANGATTHSFLTDDSTGDNFTFRQISLTESSRGIAAPVLTNIFAKYSSAITVGAVRDVGTGGPDYDSLISVQGRLFLAKLKGNGNADITSANAIYLGLDGASFNDVKSKIINLGYTSSPLNNGRLFTFIQEGTPNADLKFPAITMTVDARSGRVGALSDTFVSERYTSSNKVGDIVCANESSLNFDSLIFVRGNLFLAKVPADQNVEITSSSALPIRLDVNSLKFITDKIANSVPVGLYLSKDNYQNFHLVVTNNSGADAMSVDPVDIVFDQSGKLVDITSISYASLNYYLETNFSARFDMRGNFSKVDDPESSLSVVSIEMNPSISAINDSSTSLFLYKISHQTIGIDGKVENEDLGYLISTVGDSADMTLDNIFYLGDDVDLNDLVTKRPSFFVTDSTLLIVWDGSPTSDPSYLTAVKGSALASVDRLTTEKLLTLERDLNLDIDADGFSDGSIEYTKISVSNSVTLIKTSDGNFFTLANGATFPDSGRITLDNLRLKSLIAAIPAPAELRSYETSAKVDLNGDGILGAAAEATILTNDSFSIYKTTLGDVVYSAVPGIQQGDAIPDPISIGLSEVELSRVVNSDQVVATIQSGKLYLATKNQDSITGLTILRESVFELVGSSGTQRYASFGVPADWKFNGILSDRLGFLDKEIFYNVDLNDDGVIGDAIVKQFASSFTSTIYQTASGVIYISSNNDLNFGDFLDKSALRLYWPDNAPDKIDACIRTAEGVFVFRSDMQDNDQVTHSKETFVSGSNGLTSIGIAALPLQDLIQAEIAYGIDIDGNERLGGVVSRVIFGAQGGDSYPAITMQDTGLYQLDIGGEANAPNVLIAARGANYGAGDSQPFSDVYFLKNSQNSANTFWNVPNYGLRRSATVIGQGIFDGNPSNAIDIVIKDAPKVGTSGPTNHYVVSFDSSGSTTKPNGTLLSPFAFYNQELKIGTDLDSDGLIGDTVSKIGSSDTFGIYALNHSGAVVVTEDGTWVDEDPNSVDVQLSTNFLSLKNSSGSNWLPFGWKVTSAPGNLFNLSSSADRAVVKQVAFNPDDTLNVYVSRTIMGAKGPTNVIYNVAFNSAGVTKNPTGTVVPMAELFVTEMQKSLDINGDGFVGAPFVAVSLTQKLAVPNQLDTNVINPDIWFVSAKVFKSGNSSGNGIANLLLEGSALTLFETRTSTKNSYFLSNGDPRGISALQFPGENPSFIYDFLVLNSKFSRKPYFVLICKDTSPSTRKLLVLGPDNNYGFDKAAEVAPTFRTTIGDNPRFVGSGDFNGDGHSDVVIINPSGIQIFRSDGRGKLANLQTINGSTLRTPFNGGEAYAAICDANGDRRSDLVVIANSNDGEIFTSFINKNGRLVQQEVVILDTAIKYNSRSSYTGISSGDLNGDKLDDIVLTGSSDNSVLVVFGTKQGYSTGGAFFSSLALTGINSPLQSHIVDINLDGRADVVVLDRSASGTLQVDAFFGKGNNSFTEAQRIISTEDLRKPTEDKVLTPRSTGDSTLSVGDFNNDGAPDLLISTITENIIFYNFSKSVTSGSRIDVTNPAQSASFTGLIDFGNLDSYLSTMELSKTVGFRGSIHYTDGTPAPVASVPDISIVGVPQDFSMNLVFGSP